MTGLLLSAASAVASRFLFASAKAVLLLAFDVLEIAGERR